jgi:hypothetical protein
VTAVVIGAVLALGWFLGVSPLLNGAAQAETDRQAVEQTNAAQQAQLAAMKEQFDRLDELEAELADLRLAIPSEVDSDFIYGYLAGIQAGVPTVVETIVTGEAVPYGQVTDTPDGETVDPSTAAGATQFEGLYTVPITITFAKGVTWPEIVTFAGAMQVGPRVLLVTSITRPTQSDGSSGTITAYMFVMAESDDTPGSAAHSHDEALEDYTQGPLAPWGTQGSGTPAPTPTPSGSATPTPTPTGTPAP